MQTMLLMLTMFLAGQVSAPTGDRYPTEPTEAPSETATESTLGSEADEVAPPAQSVFDEIDREAQPLTPPPQSQPLQGTAAPSTSTQATPQQNAITTQEDTPVTSTPETQPTRKTTTAAGEADPAKVLASFLEAPFGNELIGTPLSLAEAIDNSLSRADQTQRIVSYWELSQAVANYYLAFKERAELTTLRQGITLPHLDWTSSQQASDARLKLALDRVRVAQQYLAQLMGNTAAGFSPLPSDVPYSGAYETRYAQIFQSRHSALAKSLNDLLPGAHQDLLTRTKEIDSARQWMFAASDKRSPQSDGQELLKAYELYAARRRIFLGAVKEYNLGIVRYTEIATPGTLDTERLVAMLIRTGSSPENTFDTDVQRTTAEEPAAEEAASPNDSSSTPPASRSDGWNSAPQSNAERSILVPRS